MPYLEDIKQNVIKEIQVIQTKPPWMLYVGGVVLLFVLLWTGWVIWDLKHPKTPSTGVEVNAPIAEELEDMETETITTTTTYYPKKAEAEVKLGLPVTNNAKELLVTGAEIAPAKYGATTAVYHNTSTAGYRTAIVYKPTPLFAFKRDWAIGGGVGVGKDGTTYAGRVRLDVLQIKNVIVSPEVQIDYSNKEINPKGMIWMEYRR